MDTLYFVGVERLAAECLLEERWVNRNMYILSYFIPVFWLTSCCFVSVLQSRSVLLFALAALAACPASPTKDLARLSSFHRSASYWIYLISNAMARSLLSVILPIPRTMLKPWTILSWWAMVIQWGLSGLHSLHPTYALYIQCYNTRIKYWV